MAAFACVQDRRELPRLRHASSPPRGARQCNNSMLICHSMANSSSRWQQPDALAPTEYGHSETSWDLRLHGLHLVRLLTSLRRNQHRLSRRRWLSVFKCCRRWLPQLLFLDLLQTMPQSPAGGQSSIKRHRLQCTVRHWLAVPHAPSTPSLGSACL